MPILPSLLLLLLILVLVLVLLSLSAPHHPQTQERLCLTISKLSKRVSKLGSGDYITGQHHHHLLHSPKSASQTLTHPCFLIDV